MGSEQEIEPPERLVLDDSQTRQLHRVACQLAAAAAQQQPDSVTESDLGPLARKTVVGVFVTLRKQGQLRGCIGNFTASLPLGDALRRAARGVVGHDPRFEPVSPDELPSLTVEVSLLHSRMLLGNTRQARVAQVTVGQHGLDIQYRGHTGLLLPRVAVDLGWDTVALLGEVCRKAGLPLTAWQAPDAEVYRFEATCFGGPFVDTR